MKILDAIRNRFFRHGEVITYDYTRAFPDVWFACTHQFSVAIWYNVCDILTDLIEDVKITNANPSPLNAVRFAAFKSFQYAHGKQVLQRLYDDGYVVIGWNEKMGVFWQMKEREYVKVSEDGVMIARPSNPENRCYVMKSATYITYGKSDKQLCKGFLDFLDDVLNGSATVSKRLGAVVVASPKNLTNAPTAVVLTKEQKKDIEKELREQYGALSRQSNVMVLPREMSWQTINLAGLDLKMQEKTKTAILAIADRIKVPANQIAIIDAQSSKALANGGEIREGDKLKYKSFRRLYERTFADMAREFLLKIDYAIDGEPVGDSGEVSV